MAGGRGGVISRFSRDSESLYQNAPDINTLGKNKVAGSMGYVKSSSVIFAGISLRKVIRTNTVSKELKST